MMCSEERILIMKGIMKMEGIKRGVNADYGFRIADKRNRISQKRRNVRLTILYL